MSRFGSYRGYLAHKFGFGGHRGHGLRDGDHHLHRGGHHQDVRHDVAHDDQYGTRGNDAIDGGAGDDRIHGGRGDDVVSGGAGNDRLDLGEGNDTAIYKVADNDGARDFYDGGRGVDTLRLVLTLDQALSPAVQADIQACDAFLAENSGGRCGSGPIFEFSAFALSVRGFEKLDVSIESTEPTVNAPPSDLSLDTLAISENAAVGDVIGTLSATDPDGDALTYAIVDDPYGKFVIDGDQLKLAAPVDFEAATLHDVTIEVSDGNGGTTQQRFDIGVTDVNEAPVLYDNQSLAVDENSRAGTFVGRVFGFDVDLGDSMTYAITGGNTGGAFAIDPLTGGLTVASAAALDFETTPVFPLTVSVTDEGGLTDSGIVTVSLNDVVERPAAAGRVAAAADAGAVTHPGTGGDDVIAGDAGDNVLDGGAGNDTLDGNRGDDVVIGGTGNDVFVFDDGDGDDTIADFEPGADVIDVSDFAIADSAAVLDQGAVDVGPDVLLAIDADDSLTLLGLNRADLSAGDFLF